MQTKLKTVLAEKHITGYKLSKELCIPTPIIYSVINGTLPSYPKYRKLISDYLDMSEEELF